MKKSDWACIDINYDGEYHQTSSSDTGVAERAVKIKHLVSPFFLSIENFWSTVLNG
jgi:hypothetical protein